MKVLRLDYSSKGGFGESSQGRLGGSFKGRL